MLQIVRDRQIGRIDRIARRDRDLVGDRDARAQRAARRRRVVDAVARCRVFLDVEVEADRHARVEEIGLGEVELEPLGALADRRGGADILATTHEVGFADRDFRDEAVRRRIAARHREIAGGLILDLHVDHDAIGRGARLVGDANLLEIAEVVEATLGAIDQDAVVGVAFADLELAAHDIVARAGIATHVDALDIDARPFVDDEVDADGLGGGVAVAARTNLREGVAAAGERLGQRLDRLFDGVAIIDLTGRQTDQRHERSAGHVGQTRLHRHIGHAVLRPFVHGDVDDIAALRRVEMRLVAHDLEVGIAVLQVVAADQFEVGGNAVGIVDVGILEERQEVHFRRLHQADQLAGRIGLVAREIDDLDAGLVALVDRIDDVDAAVRQVDGAVADLGGGAAGPAIDFLDSLDVRGGDGGAERPTRTQLHLGQELLALDLAVALEGDAIDAVVFRNLDHDVRAAAAHAHRGEQAAVAQRLLAGRDAAGVRPVKIGSHHLGVDTAVALHRDRLGMGNARKRQAADQRPDHGQAGPNSLRTMHYADPCFSMAALWRPTLRILWTRRPFQS